MALALLGLILITCFGFLLISCFWRPSIASFAERLALGYAVGLAVVTYLMFGILAVHLRLSSPFVFGALIALSLVTGVLAWYRHGPSVFVLRGGFDRGTPTSPLTRMVSTISIALLLGLWVAAVAVALYWPIWSWDALAMYEFRGRAIYLEQSLEFMKDEAYWGSFPLHTSLAHSLVYLLGGHAPNIIYPPYYLALLVVFYLQSARLSGELIAGLLTATLATTPLLWQHAAEPLTNLPFTFYFASGVFYVYRWALTLEHAPLVFAGALLGFSAWTRYGSEPLFLSVLVPVTWHALLKRRYSAPPLLLLTFLWVNLPWLLYEHLVLRVSAAALYGVHLDLWDPARLYEILTYLTMFLLSVRTQGVLWLLLFFLFLLNASKLRDPSTLLVAIILLGLGAWIASIYLTSLPAGYLAVSSGERLLLSLVPVATLYCAVNPLTRRPSRSDNEL